MAKMAPRRRAPGLDLTEGERGRLRGWLREWYVNERADGYDPEDSDPLLAGAIRKLLEFVGGEPIPARK